MGSGQQCGNRRLSGTDRVADSGRIHSGEDFFAPFLTQLLNTGSEVPKYTKILKYFRNSLHVSAGI